MNAQRQWDQVFESLDGLGSRIYETYVNGNKSDARSWFMACPADRRAYLAYTIIGRHMTSFGNPHVIDLDDFFRSVTA